MAAMAQGDPSGWGDRVVGTIEEYSSQLWVITLVFFVLGDIVTTSIGLLDGRAAEVGPLVAPLLNEFGLLAMIPLKALAVGMCFALWKVIPAPHSIGVPLGLATFGVLVTGWNTLVLVVAFS